MISSNIFLLLLGIAFTGPAQVNQVNQADRPLEGAVIVVDPGHGGQRYSKSYTGGTKGVSSKLTESELNLRVALELAKKLKDAGATVHLTRTADHRLSREGSSASDELHARIDFFEKHNCHFFLSIHHNAGKPDVTGHTTLYKHNAKDDTLYEALATSVNEALVGAVPGPKLKLIKGSYHILRETEIPGTISEAGFMSNQAFDDVSNTESFPAQEATAIAQGAIAYWKKHNKALNTLRDRLAKERAEHPRDPKTVTSIECSKEFQKQIQDRLNTIAPNGKYDPANVGEYLTKYKTLVVKDANAKFNLAAKWDGKVIHLTGEVSNRADHDQFIDLLVAMKLYAIRNDVVLPKPAK
ncbi:MAG: N-acetylmuramoyl-L-alanine amidase [Gemmataceae bacterium]